MRKPIHPGLEFELSAVVRVEDTAANYGSGDLEVLATPAMIAFMEKTALMSVSANLPEGSTTVGTEVHISHLRATAVGKTVICLATLTGIEGRKLSFRVEVKDEKGLVGEGNHTRYIVDSNRFMEKLREDIR